MVCSTTLFVLPTLLQILQIIQIYRLHYVTPYITQLPLIPQLNQFQLPKSCLNQPVHVSSQQSYYCGYKVRNNRQKERLYLLVIILEDLIAYRRGIINFKIGPIQLTIKKRQIKISFNILLLGQDKAVLRIPQLQEYNLKINQVIGQVNIKDT